MATRPTRRSHRWLSQSVRLTKTDTVRQQEQKVVHVQAENTSTLASWAERREGRRERGKQGEKEREGGGGERQTDRKQTERDEETEIERVRETETGREDEG